MSKKVKEKLKVVTYVDVDTGKEEEVEREYVQGQPIELLVPRLTVDNVESNPVYTFEGPWQGSYILTILRGLRRAYAKHKLGLRRKEATLTTETPVLEGATNE